MKRGRGEKSTRKAERDLVRFGISIPEDLLEKFDAHLSGHKNQNRSEAIRDLIRGKLAQDSWSEGRGEQLATVTLIYESANAEFLKRLAESKRAMGERLLASMQLRLDTRHELELLALKGAAGALRAEAENLVALKGILHGRLAMTSPAAP